MLVNVPHVENGLGSEQAPTKNTKKKQPRACSWLIQGHRSSSFERGAQQKRPIGIRNLRAALTLVTPKAGGTGRSFCLI